MGPSADTHNLNTRLLRFRSQPSSEDAIALAGDLMAAGRYGDARGVAIGAQADDAPDSRLLLIEGRAWYLERDLVRAQAALLRAVQADPTFGDAFRLLGEVLLKRGDPERAKLALTRAAGLLPGDAEVERLRQRAEQLARVAAEASEPAPPQASAPSARAAQEKFRPAPPTWPARPSPAPRASQHQAEPAFDDDEATSSFRREQVFADFSDGALDAPYAASSAGQVGAPSRASSAGGVSSPGMHAAPSSAGTVRAPSVPGTRSAPGTASSPGMRTAPGTFSSPGMQTSPGTQSAPGTRTAPGTQSAPGTRTAPGTQSAPGTPLGAFGASSPGTRTAPGISSPGMQSAPSMRSAVGVSSPGMRSAAGMSSPGMHSAAGGMSSPGMHSAPGTRSAAGTYSAPGTQRGLGPVARSSSSGQLGAPDEEAFDVEIDAPSERVDTASGLGRSPAGNGDWVGSLSTSPGLTETPASAHSSAGDEELRWDEPESSQDEEGFEPEPPIGSLPVAADDMPLGMSHGESDDPDALLHQLRAQGVLEIESGAEAPKLWVEPSEVERPGPRLGRSLTVLWVVALALLGGGYFGFQQWVKHRHAQAEQLLAEARAAAWDGDHEKLVEAERLLSVAREKHPRSAAIPERALLLQAQRLLENGSRELSALRTATARAKQLGASALHVQVAESLLAAFSGAQGADAALASAAESVAKAGRDGAELAYLVGRAQQRLGASGAQQRLEAARAQAPALLAASLALAELAHVEERSQEALAHVDAVLGKRTSHLRAQLWRAYLSADSQEPAAALRALAELKNVAAPIDRLLAALAKARLLQRSGDAKAAAEAVNAALATGTSEPSLLALLATEAERAGQLGVAVQAARAAVAGAPRSITYRVLLARILLARREAPAALALLAELPAEEAGVVMLRARAALGSDDAAQQRAALAALDALLQSSPEGADTLAPRALKLRIAAALEPSTKILRDAEKLVAKAPGDPRALLAVGEVALAVGQASSAVRALEQLVRAAPDDPEAHHMLGRARRLAVDAKGSEASFRRALELSPGHVEASIALGALLLDSGRYADADALYQALAPHSPVAARLGRVEALIGLGKLADARVQLQGVPEAQRAGSVARETGARLALAAGKAGEAVALLGPLMQGEARTPALLALYGEALYGVDQVDAAAGQFDAALALDADLPEALIGRAQVHLRAERPDDALELLEQAKEALKSRMRAPELHARMLAALGRAHLQRNKRGDIDKGRAALIAALELPGAPNEAYFWRGEADGGRRTPEAAAAFKRYLELEPSGQYAERARRALGPLL